MVIFPNNKTEWFMSEVGIVRCLKLCHNTSVTLAQLKKLK